MASFDFTPWSRTDPSSKPFDPDRLLPFHRIDVPSNRVVSLLAIRAIDGKGYRCGCRSSKDYDGKIGKDIGELVGSLVETLTDTDIIDRIDDARLFQKKEDRTKPRKPTRIPKVPDVLVIELLPKPVNEFLDDIDPLKALLGAVGEKIDSWLVDRMIRSVPAWVPVSRGNPKLPDEVEVDGILIRSYQRFDSLPLAQWHLGYDWCFRVAPSPLFTGMIGDGNARRIDNDGEETNKALAKGFVRLEIGMTVPGATVDQHVDCEIDLGAIGARPFVLPGDKPKSVPGRGADGPFFQRSDFPQSSLVDWAWPMAGQFFWAVGRSVYDCSHATADAKEGEGEGQHLNQVHPCKAIATARHAGHRFKENTKAVPAIQFMFFASNFRRSGGDFAFPALNDADYDFIVDLPPLDQLPAPSYAVGHAPEFPHNTVVLRPRLLIDPQFDHFANVVDDERNLARGGPRPIVEPIVPDDGAVPTQVRVRIPLTKMAAQNNAYGVILSMGWHDPDESLARRIKKVTVELLRIEIREPHETGDAEWVVNVGVNGRWLQGRWGFPNSKHQKVGRRTPTLNFSSVVNQAVFTLLLATDDAIHVSAHGMEQDGIGDILDKPEEVAGSSGSPDDKFDKRDVNAVLKNFLVDRTLRLAKRTTILGTASDEEGTALQLPFIGPKADWKTDIDQQDAKKASVVARAIFLQVLAEGFDENDPLGFIDPNVQEPAPRKDGVNAAGDVPNPLTVQAIIDEVGLGRFKECRLTAYQVRQWGRMEGLAFDPKAVDYTLHYRVKVDEQDA